MFNVLLCIQMRHDWRLVAVAAAVCALATIASFFLYARTPQQSVWRRLSWFAMIGIVAGTGIWTTHFVAMMAFETGLPTGFGPLATLGSLLLAIAGCAAGFAIGAGRRSGARALTLRLAGGLVVGLSIGGMHYLGMSGYRTAGHVIWNAGYVIASLMTGGVLASVALVVGQPGVRIGRQAGAAVLLLLGIVAMHFTGMTAVTIVPDASISPTGDLISGLGLAAIAVGATALILLTAVGGVALDIASRNGALNRFREALDSMPEGVSVFDPSDRLIAWNATYEAICKSRGARPVVGAYFSEIVDQALAAGAFPAAAGREAAWRAERMAAREVRGSSFVQQTADGRWTRVTERKTSDGGTISNCVDITELKLAEAALTEARDRANELKRQADMAEEVVGMGHWRLDATTRKIEWSTELYRIYGLEPGSKLELDALMAMTHPDDRKGASDRIAVQLEQGEDDLHGMTRIQRPDGEMRYLAGASRSEHNDEGEVVAVIGALVDVTDRRLAELALSASEERFRKLAINAPAIIAESDLHGVMTYISPASLAMTGYTPEELVGKPFAQWIEPEDAQKIGDMCRSVIAGKGDVAPSPVEFRGHCKSGETRWFECMPTPSYDADSGLITGFNDVIRDIEQRKALEAQLRAATAEAEDAAQTKADFLANMSHELRTPLTSIIGFTALASEQPELSEVTRNYVERVREASRALLCTVNDVLDFSKLEAGQVAIQPEPVDLGKLCRGTLELFAPQAGAKDLQLVLDDEAAKDIVVRVDPDRIRQILLNFISNAVKFTEAGQVTLRTGFDTATDMLAVEVIDTGGGIPPDKLDLLFKRFSQVDGSAMRSTGGTGLGLAICKGLVEAMGGRIGADSRPGEGSRFWFEIPAAISSIAIETVDDQVVEPMSFRGARVLIADDHKVNRDLVRLYLAGLDAEVSEAGDGVEAVALAGDWPFDVILMDLRMPNLDGEGALKAIRASTGPNDATPILAFTADAGPEFVRQLRAMGFDDVVGKPAEPAILIGAIARAVSFGADVGEDETYAA
ncbi:MAG TPA: PAS domain S-box protein [Caulobacteraceae bacterium]